MEPVSVLVLNQNYEPLNVCHVRRALVLVLRGKAEVIENASAFFRTASSAIQLPSVIRLLSYIRRPRPRLRLTRKEIFNRDGWMCAYCGKATRDLTIDHVIPRHRGGPHTWDNLVSACKACNHKKAGRTPAEAHMELRRQPGMPHVSVYHAFLPYLASESTWRKFVAGSDAAAAD